MVADFTGEPWVVPPFTAGVLFEGFSFIESHPVSNMNPVERHSAASMSFMSTIRSVMCAQTPTWRPLDMRGGKPLPLHLRQPAKRGHENLTYCSCCSRCLVPHRLRLHGDQSSQHHADRAKRRHPRRAQTTFDESVTVFGAPFLRRLSGSSLFFNLSPVPAQRGHRRERCRFDLGTVAYTPALVLLLAVSATRPALSVWR